MMSNLHRIAATIVAKKIDQALILMSLPGKVFSGPLVFDEKGLLRLGGRIRGCHCADTMSV